MRSTRVRELSSRLAPNNCPSTLLTLPWAARIDPSRPRGLGSLAYHARQGHLSFTTMGSGYCHSWARKGHDRARTSRPSAVLLFWLRPSVIPTWQVGLGIVLLAVVWISTGLLQVPCHNLLSKGFNVAVHERLVATNWVRTVAWSWRGLLVLWMTWCAWR